MSNARDLLELLHRHAIGMSHRMVKSRLNLSELTTMTGWPREKTRSALASLNRMCCVDSEIDHGIAFYAITTTGRQRAMESPTPRERSRRGQPYEKKPRDQWARPMRTVVEEVQTLQPREVAARVARSVFDWRP